MLLFGHYVDDFNGTEDKPVADSAHFALADFLALLGLQTKPSKAQVPPKNRRASADRHRGRGAHSPTRTAGENHAPDRRGLRLCRRAAIKPLYSRAADTAADHALSGGTQGPAPPGGPRAASDGALAQLVRVVVLGRAALDMDYACHEAPARFLDLASCKSAGALWEVGAPGGRRSAHPGTGTGSGAVCSAGRSSALRPKRSHCTLVGVLANTSLA